jgi:glycosyltransferase involved in cell wall biosynthesis
VHLHSAKAGLCGRLVLRGRYITVFQPHGWSFLAVGGLQHFLARVWEGFAARWTDALICVSEDERTIGQSAGITHPKYMSRANAVHLPSYSAVPQPEARELLALPEAGCMVLCVARLSRQKGVDQLLETWAMVREACPEARLEIVGEGPDRHLLETRASAWPEVRFHGLRSDVRLWYSASDLVVLPSRYEGMAMTPLEAMAVGRSVVGFDVAGFAECLGHIREPSPVQPRGDVRALAGAIIRRLGDEQLRLDESRRNVAQVYAHHSIVPAGEWMSELYSELLQARSSDLN